MIKRLLRRWIGGYIVKYYEAKLQELEKDIEDYKSIAHNWKDKAEWLEKENEQLKLMVKKYAGAGELVRRLMQHVEYDTTCDSKEFCNDTSKLLDFTRRFLADLEE